MSSTRTRCLTPSPSPVPMFTSVTATLRLVEGEPGGDVALVADLSTDGAGNYRLLLLDPANLNTVLWLPPQAGMTLYSVVIQALEHRRDPEFEVSAKTATTGKGKSARFFTAIKSVYGRDVFTWVIGQWPDTERKSKSGKASTAVRIAQYRSYKEAWVHSGEILDYLKDFTVDWTQMNLNETEAAL